GFIIVSTGAVFKITSYGSSTSLGVSPSTPFIGFPGTTFSIYYNTDFTTAIVDMALTLNRSSNNTSIGHSALERNWFGNNNTSVGVDSGRFQDASFITSIGVEANSGDQYTGGTVSQSGTTITGVGTNFTPNMVGGLIKYGLESAGNTEWS